MLPPRLSKAAVIFGEKNNFNHARESNTCPHDLLSLTSGLLNTHLEISDPKYVHATS